MKMKKYPILNNQYPKRKIKSNLELETLNLEIIWDTQSLHGIY